MDIVLLVGRSVSLLLLVVGDLNVKAISIQATVSMLSSDSKWLGSVISVLALGAFVERLVCFNSILAV